MGSSLNQKNNIVPGDYICCKTQGGTLFGATVNSILGRGHCSVIPDGGKSPIPIKMSQVSDIIKPLKKPVAEPKELKKDQVIDAINKITDNNIQYIDLPLVFLSMGENSLSVRERNAGLVVSILQDYEKAGVIVRRGGDYNGITWETVNF